jgi:hypothetical protein
MIWWNTQKDGTMAGKLFQVTDNNDGNDAVVEGGGVHRYIESRDELYKSRQDKVAEVDDFLAFAEIGHYMKVSHFTVVHIREAWR